MLIPSQSHREGIIGAVKNRSFFMGAREEEEERKKRVAKYTSIKNIVLSNAE